MTRRERLERKLEKREEWAGKAAARSDAAWTESGNMAKQIPLGQPILVGHHSEKRDRNFRKRIQRKADKSIEEHNKACHHRSKAHGLERQLDNSIFSDDDNAIQQLEQKAENLERERDRMKAINAAWRKAGKPGADDLEGWQKIADAPDVMMNVNDLARVRLGMARDALNRGPFPSYALTNLGATIRQARKRIGSIKRQHEKTAKAKQAGGVIIDYGGAGPIGKETWAMVTFAEKPEYSIIKTLKAAGFYWSSGSWHGYSKDLPEEVKKLGKVT